jgi:hypothetical protein
MNFLTSSEARFNVIKIGKLNGENIHAQFIEVQSKLQLRARKGKMMKPQLTMETNVESFATQKKNKRVKKEKTKNEKREKLVDDIVMHKNPKEFNEAKCKTIDNVMLNEFDNCFPLCSLEILEVELSVQHFFEPPS